MVLLTSAYWGLRYALLMSLVATAVALWLLMGTRYWIKINDYSFRYLFPSLLLVQAAVAGMAVSGLGLALPARRGAGVGFVAIASAVLLAAGAWSYGPPSVAGVRRDLDARFGGFTADLLAAMKADWREAETTLKILRVDGGMANSNWTMQRLADLTGTTVDRPQIKETTALGAAYLAGLRAGFFPEPDRFLQNWQLERRFTPQMNEAARERKLSGWAAAVRRLLS